MFSKQHSKPKTEQDTLSIFMEVNVVWHLCNINLSNPEVYPNKPRKYIDLQVFEELTTFIRRYGVLEFILIPAGLE